MWALTVHFTERYPACVEGEDVDDCILGREHDHQGEIVLRTFVVLVPADAAVFAEALQKSRHSWRCCGRCLCGMKDGDLATFAVCDRVLHDYLMSLARAGTGSQTASCTWSVSIRGKTTHASWVTKTGVVSTVSDLGHGHLSADVVDPFLMHVLDQRTSSAYGGYSHAFVKDFLQYCEENNTVTKGVGAGGLVVSSSHAYVSADWFEYP